MQPNAGKRAQSTCRDRISQLPDSILSFSLPTKTVIRTSLLSKRWKNLWASVPSLSFSCGDFVDGFLKHRKRLDVDVFNLCIGHDDGECCRNNHCDKWISYAVENNVKVLYVGVHKDIDAERIEFPGNIFICQSLEELSLMETCDNLAAAESLPQIKAPELISLCRLKKLNLCGFQINDDLLERIISACTLLGDLHLKLCKFKYPVIYSETMKKLRLDLCTVGLLEVTTPNLKFLQYDVLSHKVYLRDLLSLERAKVCFPVSYFLED